MKAAARELAAWGFRSMHGDWSDEETQRSAARDALTAAAPLIEAAMRERTADVIRAVRETYYPDGASIWLGQWLRGDDEKRRQMETAVLSAWSGVRS